MGLVSSAVGVAAVHRDHAHGAQFALELVDVFDPVNRTGVGFFYTSEDLGRRTMLVDRLNSEQTVERQWRYRNEARGIELGA